MSGIMTITSSPQLFPRVAKEPRAIIVDECDYACWIDGVDDATWSLQQCDISARLLQLGGCPECES